MGSRILGRFLLTAVALLLAFSAMIPLKDKPFETYLMEEVAPEKLDEFKQIVENAKKQVDDQGKPKALLVGLREIGEIDNIDYSTFFTDINVRDIKNLKKRNTILLQELLKQSKGKLKLGLDLKGGISVTLRAEDKLDEQGKVVEKDLSQAISILSERINGLGIAEAIVRAKGKDRIEIQIPGASTKDDPEIINIVKKPAKLEFRLIHRNLRPGPGIEAPIGYEAKFEEREDKKTGEIEEVHYFVKIKPEADGSIIQRSQPSYGELGSVVVSMNFTKAGSEKFAQITKRIADENKISGSIGQLAIVLDGKLYSAPTVEKEINSPSAQISGTFSEREAQELANVLNNPLEFELSVEEQSEIGPSLAEEASDQSIKAATYGIGSVVVFMILFYGVSGIIAVISIFVNIILVLGTLAIFGATMSLPSIAALVITAGTAVDGNILILERIREELNAGKSIKTALYAGFDKAFSTIVDANLTTLIIGVILMSTGIGPVRGFGVTLTIGVVSTMFCVLVTSRGMMELLVNYNITNKLLLVQFTNRFNFNYMKYRKAAFVFSWIVVLAGLVAFGFKFDRIFGIDFTGGDEVVLSFDNAHKIEIGQIDFLAKTKELGEIAVTYQKPIGSEIEQMKLQTATGQSPKAISALSQEFPNANLQVISESKIGPTVGDEITTYTLYSMTLALAGILLYVAFRFEWGYGMGAVVSTIHDILMSVGIFVISGGQFTAPMVAAVLMVVGYSINDTIIVFDRIREELKLRPTMNLYDIINVATNHVLVRSILTSVTTFTCTLALYIFGAGIIKDFAFIFMLGIIVGTFSSIFIAAPVFYAYHKGNRRHVEESHDILPHYEWQSGSKASKK